MARNAKRVSSEGLAMKSVQICSSNWWNGRRRDVGTGL